MKATFARGGVAALFVVGCAELGVVSDGSSLSSGRANAGSLLDGRRLPSRGKGYVVYPLWEARGLRYGTDELIALLEEVAQALPAGPPLGIGDLSREFGGDGSPYHRSHQTGRDVDLILFVLNPRGKAVQWDQMTPADQDGNIADGIRFDPKRTWLLVKALLSARSAQVANIFLAEPLIALVLDHAREIGESPSFIEYAREIMVQPSAAAPHNDHMHVRVMCSAEDEARGCIDFVSRKRKW